MAKKKNNIENTIIKKIDDDFAYVYIVKHPASNELTICAWDSIIYAGTPVIYPIKSGFDLGFVVDFAPVPNKKYCPGCSSVRGACLHFGDTDSEEDDPYIMDDTVHQCTSCMGCQVVKEPEKIRVDGEVTWIDHLATPTEMAKYSSNLAKVEEAIRVCREMIEKHKLNMKLINAHFMVGEPKVIFYFVSDERVDFRALVKDLGAVFKLRIELKQIGVRDESSLLGGLSICGRDYCCHSINKTSNNRTSANPIAIKMAKEQNLSLNSAKISGPCGRLLCCLAYEYDYYMEEKASCPPEDTRLEIDGNTWRVAEVNILSRKLLCRTYDGRQLFVPFEEVSFDSTSERWVVSKDFQDELFSPE